MGTSSRLIFLGWSPPPGFPTGRAGTCTLSLPAERSNLLSPIMVAGDASTVQLRTTATPLECGTRRPGSLTAINQNIVSFAASSATPCRLRRGLRGRCSVCFDSRNGAFRQPGLRFYRRAGCFTDLVSQRVQETPSATPDDGFRRHPYRCLIVIKLCRQAA